MNLPLLFKQIYGEVTMSGLYSFEFVDKQRKTIEEIFFMQPPTTKSVEEVSRSSTVPTLNGNYNLDAGVGTKSLNISGNLWFLRVGSPKNPVAFNSADLDDKIDGLNEFFKIRWMLMRYKDYTITKNNKILIPSATLSLSKGLDSLYKRVEQNINDEIGALIDEIELIFHDYDLDDHYYTRISNFSATHNATDFLSIDYSIQGEMYERYDSKKSAKVKIKKSDKEEVESIVKKLNSINYEENFDNIQIFLGYNNEIYSPGLDLNSTIDKIIEENQNIQQNNSSIFDNLPDLISSALEDVREILDSFIGIYVPDSMITDYENGDLTIDELVDISLIEFYNSTQKIRILLEGMSGIIESIPKLEEIRYYATADSYVLTEEQYNEEDKKVSTNTSFLYHIIKQGETMKSIAVIYYGDPDKFINILNVNDFSENDLIDNDLTGKILKIPIEISTTSRSKNNIIYDSNLDPDAILNFLHGRDILLRDGTMVLSSSGDLRTVEGINNTLQSLDIRLKTPKGGLNLFSIDFGVIKIDEGNYPFLVKISKFIDDVISQIKTDPRVLSVEMKLETLQIEGEQVKFNNTIELLGDASQEVEVG